MSTIVSPPSTEQIQHVQEHYRPLPHVVDLHRAIVIAAQTQFAPDLRTGNVSDMIAARGMQECWERSYQHQQRFGARLPLEDASLERYRLLAAAYVGSVQVLARLVEISPDVSHLETPAVFQEAWPRLFTEPTYRPDDLLAR